MKFIIVNQLGQRIWLTLHHDFMPDIIYVGLHPKQPKMHPHIELYNDLHDDQHLTLGRPEWSDKTKIIFDDSELDVKPHRYLSSHEEDGETVKIFTLKITNGAH